MESSPLRLVLPKKIHPQIHGEISGTTARMNLKIYWGMYVWEHLFIMKANIFHLITCSDSVMASLLWYLSTLRSSVYLLSCHLCQAQKEKRDKGLHSLKCLSAHLQFRHLSHRHEEERDLLVSGSVWDCSLPTVTQKSVKKQEQSLILQRPISAPHPPGSPFHVGFGTEVLATEHFYSKLILYLWYEWTEQCPRIHKISTPLHLIPEWKALNQGMLQEARHILGWRCIILLQGFGQTSPPADCSVTINAAPTHKTPLESSSAKAISLSAILLMTHFCHHPSKGTNW